MVMKRPQLHLRFVPDTDQTGELFVHAESEGFAGAASAWFHFREIREFGELLTARCPLPPGETLTLKGGYWETGTQRPRLEETLVGLTVYAVGTTGTTAVGVELMDGTYDGQRKASRAQVRLEILSDCSTLRTFGEAIAGLVQGGERTVGL